MTTRLIFLFSLVAICASKTVFGAPKVVATIAPLHSLVAELMQGVGEPALLFSASRSPHGAGLKPSQVRALVDADLIVLVDSDFERSVEKVIHQISQAARAHQVLTLSKVEGMQLHSGRDIGLDSHHDDHHEENDHASEKHDHPEEGELDPHLWLSTANASTIATVVANRLANLDTENAEIYLRNAELVKQRILETRSAMSNRLQNLSNDWLFFHDAYQYLEKEFDLAPVATVMVDAERQVSGKRLRKLVGLVNEGTLKCIFTEPQLRSDLIDTLVDKTNVKVLVIDPLGSKLLPGPGLWFDLMNNMAEQLSSCR